MNPAKYEDSEEEREVFLPVSQPRDGHSSPERKRPRKTTWYLRLLLEVVMAITIIGLLLKPSLPYQWAANTEPSTPVPMIPKKEYTFLPDPKFAHEKMFDSEEENVQTLHNWVPLSAAARGYIKKSSDWSSFDLPEPYMVPVNYTSEGAGYMVSVFHQLHCLSYLAEHYRIAWSGVPLTKEVGHHSAHCFDYIRQSLMCGADTTLEGKTDAGPGWGSKHMCTDYDQVLKWTNEHGAYPRRENMPDLEQIL